MNVTPETTVGTIATEHPLATKIFARHGIDFCCGGGEPLGEVCRTKDLDVATLLEEIKSEIESDTGPGIRWDEKTSDELIDHILATYHRPLDEELPRLEAMVRKVYGVHRDKDPERLGELVEVYCGLKSELFSHMQKEEQILFPMMRAGHGAMAGGPISVMHIEHEEAGSALARIRELTDDFTVPAEACNTWRALWHGLADLERALHEHIHLENNVLFPKALAS